MRIYQKAVLLKGALALCARFHLGFGAACHLVISFQLAIVHVSPIGFLPACPAGFRLLYNWILLVFVGVSALTCFQAGQFGSLSSLLVSFRFGSLNDTSPN